LFYEKRGRVVPVVAKFYMKHLEQGAINTVINKPLHWYKYVDKTFVDWSYGKRCYENF